MRDFHGVIEELKLYLANDKEIKILDKDVANVLEISQANFATMKRRNSTPFENILKFCEKEKISCSKIFFTNYTTKKN